MGEQQRRELTTALREHELEVAHLTQALAHIETVSLPAQQAHQHIVYLTAQMTKHRISMALLASRLGEPAPVVQ